MTLTDGSTPREREQHSYPPTPPVGPIVVVNPPSPRSVHAKLNSVSLSPSPRPASAQSAVTHFVVTPRPLVPPAQETAQTSIFSRLFAVIKSNAPSHDYSFTLAPIPGAPTSPVVPGSPTASGAASPGAGYTGTSGGTLAPGPLLAFHDRTPVWTARCSSGLIELDEGQCRVLGVDPVFYVAVALTYLEFLEEREVSSSFARLASFANLGEFECVVDDRRRRCLCVDRAIWSRRTIDGCISGPWVPAPKRGGIGECGISMMAKFERRC